MRSGHAGISFRLVPLRSSHYRAALENAAVRLTILGHDGTTEVAALPDDAPPRFGPIILTLLDLVIDPGAREP